jgi:hypothetical protein
MRAVALFALLWFQYAIVTVNYRAIAQGRYGACVATDALIAAGNFTLFKLIIGASTWLELGGYTLGGCLGGVTGIYLTRRWSAGKAA